VADPALLEERGKVLAQARAALDALVIWELTHATDLRRYHRAGLAMDMARDLEKAYATRVSDVDLGEDTALGRGVLDGRINIRHVDHDPLGDFERNVRLGVAVDNANRQNIALQPDLAPLAQTAEALLRDAHRAIDQLPPHEADRVIDRVNGTPPLIPPVLDAEARRAPYGEPDRLPPPLQAVRARQNLDALDALQGAPYGEPPRNPLLAALPDHLRPFVGLYQEAMERMQPDHVTRVANRITALTEAMNAASAIGEDTTVLQRELRDTLTDLEQEHVPPAPGEIT
jgi:hypothetical protein